MTDPKPQVDFSRIEFPSDAVTLKQLRDKTGFPDRLGEDLSVMHMREEGFVRFGFAKQLGDEDEILNAVFEALEWMEADGPCDEATQARELQVEKDCLAREYIRFGVADGPETAKQLIRRLEALGAEQAKALFDPPPH
jgi:hypothetical protein